VKGITICVGYDDLLEITLVRNMRHLSECVVVTHPDDQRTKDVVSKVPGAKVFETDAFYRHGAKFNKGLAMEEGFDALGRDGWIIVFDADTLLPERLSLHRLNQSTLYSARRLVLQDPLSWTPSFEWSQLSPIKDVCFAGYFHLFHADDSHIKKRPWYDVTFTHAGGGDGYFQSRWTPAEKVYLPFYVLHLGPHDTNWCGRISPRRDGAIIDKLADHDKDMRLLVRTKGWRGERPSPGEFNEHVDVPGHSPTGFKP